MMMIIPIINNDTDKNQNHKRRIVIIMFNNYDKYYVVFKLFLLLPLLYIYYIYFVSFPHNIYVDSPNASSWISITFNC